ncbi:M6 family metalloprotease domain-containing protein [Aliikangiella coralliicola]|nr:M6 family metalloprotease domain-containing protein [Aliikangiella coralliicola]
MKKIFKPLLTGVALSMLSTSVFADYVKNQATEVNLPDGSSITVYITGDEYYKEVRSGDGRLLTLGDDGYVYYAQLNADGTDLEPSTLKFQKVQSASVNRMPIVNLPESVIKAKRAAAIAENQMDKPVANRAASVTADDHLLGDVVGATVIVDFSDDPAAFSKDQVEDLLNGQNYSEFGNQGSVNEYFKDISGNKLNYTNLVTHYYRAAHPKSVYNDPRSGVGRRDLVKEVIDFLMSSGVDTSRLSVDKDGRVHSLNIFYAGYPNTPWSKGLWPHRGWYNYEKDGVKFSNYQMTSMNRSLSIGVFAHENGHMLADWPDLYDYGHDSSGTGSYDLMSDSGGTSPMPPNPYFRWLAGWETLIELNPAVDAGAPVGLLSATAHSNTSYVYSNPDNTNEFFFLENIHRSGRYMRTPDEGLMIWHVDKFGNNSSQDGTPYNHYMVSVEQADGRKDLENHRNYGDQNDLFDEGVEYQFNDISRAAGVWWDRSVSNININTVSKPGETITFRSEGVGVVDMNNINMGETLYPVNAITSTPKYYRLELPDDTFSFTVETFGGAGNVDLYVRKGELPTATESDCISKGETNEESCELRTSIFDYVKTYYIMAVGSPVAANFNLKVTSKTGEIVEIYSGVPVENLNGEAGSEKYFKLTRPFGLPFYNWYTFMETTTETGEIKTQIKNNDIPSDDNFDCEYTSLSTEPCITSSSNDYLRLVGVSDYTGGTLSARQISTLRLFGSFDYDADVSANEEHLYNYWVAKGYEATIDLSAASGDAQLFVRKSLPVVGEEYDCVVSTNDGNTCPMVGGNHEILLRTNTDVSGLRIELIESEID